MFFTELVATTESWVFSMAAENDEGVRILELRR